MDPGVLEAMRRWPNVPAVYGWLSLTPRGEWRLHPLGDAMQGGYGEGISNTQILSFINRNYVSGQDGTWFFQNGPQRVYVELEAAPWVWRLLPLEQTPPSGQLVSVRTPLDEPVQAFEAWLDDAGRLFLLTSHGLGLVHSLDMALAADALEQGQWPLQGSLPFGQMPQRFGYRLSCVADGA